MKFRGKIFDWNDEKGYGFVRPNGGGDKAFVHIKSFMLNSRRPQNDDEISYHVVRDKEDKYRALNIELVLSEKELVSSSNKLFFMHTFVILIYFACLIALTTLNLLPILASCIYGILSVITYFVYASDKVAAQKRQWRTEEASLHLLSFLGGWPGAFYAQRVLRHKSKKIEFQKTYRTTVILNIAIFSWFMFGNAYQIIGAIFNALR